MSALLEAPRVEIAPIIKLVVTDPPMTLDRVETALRNAYKAARARQDELWYLDGFTAVYFLKQDLERGACPKCETKFKDAADECGACLRCRKCCTGGGANLNQPWMIRR